MGSDAQGNLSFPSGDAAGSAAFAMTLALAVPEFRKPACVLAALSAIGRMYFHAHHFLDVAVGELLGVSMVLLMNRCTQFGPFGWGHTIVTQAIVALSWKHLQKLK